MFSTTTTTTTTKPRDSTIPYTITKSIMTIMITMTRRDTYTKTDTIKVYYFNYATCITYIVMDSVVVVVVSAAFVAASVTYAVVPRVLYWEFVVDADIAFDTDVVVVVESVVAAVDFGTGGGVVVFVFVWSPYACRI